jgi:hypothetical protein
MINSMKIHWMIILLLLSGCARSMSVVYYSRPETIRASNDAFDAQIESLKLNNPFYVAFQLTIFNKSDKPLELDWNRTRYLHGGKDYGVFVFSGIDPESIKMGIPNEVIPAGKTFSRQIMPLKTLAYRSRKEVYKIGQSRFFPSVLPNGNNTVALFMVQGTRQWKELLTVRIGTRESGKK